MRLCANESYQSAEAEIEALTGVKVGHTTHQRLVLRQQLSWPEAFAASNRGQCGRGKSAVALTDKQRGLLARLLSLCAYKVCTTELLRGDNQSLIDYVNSQPKTRPLVCLGDGHEGVWNLGLASLPHLPADGKFWTGITEQENLYKVGESLKRLKQAEALLWEGQLEAVRTLFSHCRLKQAKNFCAYLEQHHQRIVNYSYYQSEQLCSVG